MENWPCTLAVMLLGGIIFFWAISRRTQGCIQDVLIVGSNLQRGIGFVDYTVP